MFNCVSSKPGAGQVQSYKDWIDREAECTEVAKQWHISLDGVEGAEWRDKKEVDEWNARRAEALIKKPTVQPTVEELKASVERPIDPVDVAKPVKQWRQRSDGSFEYSINGGMWRRQLGPVPKEALASLGLEEVEVEDDPRQSEAAKQTIVGLGVTTEGGLTPLFLSFQKPCWRSC